mgnify:CR=1 FL=1
MICSDNGLAGALFKGSKDVDYSKACSADVDQYGAGGLCGPSSGGGTGRADDRQSGTGRLAGTGSVEQGQTSAAERYLERALNIAPDSSWLYKELAGLRLSEGDPRGAEGFALKALRLAPDHDDYRAGLWDLVATARDRQGDKSGARQARSKAAALRNPKARPV